MVRRAACFCGWGSALHPETREAFLTAGNFSNLTAQIVGDRDHRRRHDAGDPHRRHRSLGRRRHRAHRRRRRQAADRLHSPAWVALPGRARGRRPGRAVARPRSSPRRRAAVRRHARRLPRLPRPGARALRRARPVADGRRLPEARRPPRPPRCRPASASAPAWSASPWCCCASDGGARSALPTDPLVRTALSLFAIVAVSGVRRRHLPGRHAGAGAHRRRRRRRSARSFCAARCSAATPSPSAATPRPRACRASRWSRPPSSSTSLRACCVALRRHRRRRAHQRRDAGQRGPDARAPRHHRGRHRRHVAVGRPRRP